MDNTQNREMLIAPWRKALEAALTKKTISTVSELVVAVSPHISYADIISSDMYRATGLASAESVAMEKIFPLIQTDEFITEAGESRGWGNVDVGATRVGRTSETLRFNGRLTERSNWP